MENPLDRLEARFTGLETRFTGLEARFTGLEARFIGLEGRLTSLEERLNAKINQVDVNSRTCDERLETLLRQTHLASLRALNGTRHDGSFIPYEIIPFPDGKKPTGDEFQITRHPYPLLQTLSAIFALTPMQLNRYLTQYGVDNLAGDDQGRRIQLCQTLGISAEVIRIKGY